MTHQLSEHTVSKSIVVAVALEQAFTVWTGQINVWWPAAHSLSGDPATEVFIESKVGGRFYERASTGIEYDWGEVTVWQPPYRVALKWYLGSSQELPTQVNIQFVPLDRQQTRIQVEHRGPDLIGDLWWQRIDIFKGAWEKVLATFTSAVSSL